MIIDINKLSIKDLKYKLNLSTIDECFDIYSEFYKNKNYEKALIAAEYLEKDEKEEIKLAIFLNMHEKNKVKAQLKKVNISGVNTNHLALFALLYTNAKKEVIENSIMECLKQNPRIINILIDNGSIPDVAGTTLNPLLQEAMSIIYFNQNIVDKIIRPLKTHEKYIINYMNKIQNINTNINTGDFFNFTCRFKYEYIEIDYAKINYENSRTKAFEVMYNIIKANKIIALTPAGYINTTLAKELCLAAKEYEEFWFMDDDKKNFKEGDYIYISLLLKYMKEKKIIRKYKNTYIVKDKVPKFSEISNELNSVTLFDSEENPEVLALFSYIVNGCKANITHFKLSSLVELVFCNLQGSIRGYTNKNMFNEYRYSLNKVCNILKKLGAKITIVDDDLTVVNFDPSIVKFPLMFSLNEKLQEALNNDQDPNEILQVSMYDIKYERIMPMYTQDLCCDLIVYFQEQSKYLDY